MPTNIFDSCENPLSGESFKTLSFNEEAYMMVWTVKPNGYVPFEHIHLNQDEIFNVQKGEVSIFLNGKEHVARAGESITVPKGVAHTAMNKGKETLECVVEYRPGLDHIKMMQCLFGLIREGYLDKSGVIHIPRMGYFLIKMKAKCLTRPTSIPAPVFNMALRFFYLRGRLSGWKKLFDKYTGCEKDKELSKHLDNSSTTHL